MDKSSEKIFIYCLANHTTGGVELLHQLADYLNTHGREAYIIYVGSGPHTVPQAYSAYHIRLAAEVEDEPQNTVVTPEGMDDLIAMLKEMKRVRIVRWWLSVDNYFINCHRVISLGDLMRWDQGKGLEAFVSRLWKTLRGEGNKFANKISFRKTLMDERILHAYQCEYAQYFLQRQGLRNLAALKDYINTDFASVDGGALPKEDMVLYNPVKGYKFTRKLIAAAPDIRWVPIRNLTRTQVIDLMRKSKLYIDFGHHPGKDRMPRECALNGCCIITGKRGAAAFREDLVIPGSYKFDEQKIPIADIVQRIRYVLGHYDECTGEFDRYRESIMGERAEFEQQIETIF